MSLFKKKDTSASEEQKNTGLKGRQETAPASEPSAPAPEAEQQKIVKKARTYFTVENGSALAKISVVLMCFSVFCRLAGCVSHFGESFYLYTQIILPVATSILFIASILLFGRKALWTSSFAVLAGVVFFIFRIEYMSPSLPWYQPILCIALYVLIFALWTCTVFGVIRTKWLLVPAFALPFIYHVFVEDRIRLQTSVVSFEEGMQELSVLLIMLSMLLVALAMKKITKGRVTEKLPAIKDPVITGCAGSLKKEPEKTEIEPEAPAESPENGAPEEIGEVSAAEDTEKK